MIHVGNDIVDLMSPYVIGRGADQKFISRVLTPEEGADVRASGHPDIRLQMYWAARETAFKVISKSIPDVSAAPRKYMVFFETSPPALPRKYPRRDRPGLDTDISPEDCLQGHVTTPADVVHILVFQHENFVHCVGATFPGALNKIVFGVDRTDQADSGRVPDFCRASGFESRLVRHSARKRIAAMLSINTGEIRFKNQAAAPGGPAIPAVHIRSKKADLDISFSHDGRFTAYALFFNFSSDR